MRPEGLVKLREQSEPGDADVDIVNNNDYIVTVSVWIHSNAADWPGIAVGLHEPEECVQMRADGVMIWVVCLLEALCIIRQV